MAQEQINTQVNQAIPTILIEQPTVCTKEQKKQKYLCSWRNSKIEKIYSATVEAGSEKEAIETIIRQYDTIVHVLVNQNYDLKGNLFTPKRVTNMLDKFLWLMLSYDSSYGALGDYLKPESSVKYRKFVENNFNDILLMFTIIVNGNFTMKKID